jgi:hypothetical protein
MKNQPKPTKMGIEISEIDFNKLFRVGEKAQTFLGRKIDDPIEVYLLLKMLCFSIEDTFGFRLDAEEEAKFREMFS